MPETTPTLLFKARPFWQDKSENSKGMSPWRSSVDGGNVQLGVISVLVQRNPVFQT